jgi:hypothetical protein
MKIIIFLIFLVIVVSALMWTLRKSQAEAELERRKSAESRKKETKEAITPPADMTWPVVGPSTDENPEGDTDVEEPSMTTIEYVPPERET